MPFLDRASQRLAMAAAFLALTAGCAPTEAPSSIVDDLIQPSTVVGEPAPASLRRLTSAELTRLLPGRSLTLSDIIGPGPEIFHEDGTYEVRSRVLMSGRYAIQEDMFCTRLYSSIRERCRRLWISTAGDLFSAAEDGAGAPSSAMARVELRPIGERQRAMIAIEGAQTDTLTPMTDTDLRAAFHDAVLSSLHGRPEYFAKDGTYRTQNRIFRVGRFWVAGGEICTSAGGPVDCRRFATDGVGRIYITAWREGVREIATPDPILVSLTRSDGR